MSEYNTPRIYVIRTGTELLANSGEKTGPRYYEPDGLLKLIKSSRVPAECFLERRPTTNRSDTQLVRVNDRNNPFY